MRPAGRRVSIFANSQFAACAESRRIFVKLFVPEFLQKAEEIQAGLVSLGRWWCKNTTLPQITISKSRRGFWVDGNNLFHAYVSMLDPEDRINIRLYPASTEEGRAFMQIFRKLSDPKPNSLNTIF
jgi:hypothetical protein